VTEEINYIAIASPLLASHLLQEHIDGIEFAIWAFCTVLPQPVVRFMNPWYRQISWAAGVVRIPKRLRVVCATGRSNSNFAQPVGSSRLIYRQDTNNANKA